jgi:ubiquinone/menaquinone biosynthesis C-methylase UbiE
VRKLETEILDDSDSCSGAPLPLDASRTTRYYCGAANPEHQSHNQAIHDQFTRQAVPFAKMPSHSKGSEFELLFELSGVSGTDTVLDVACGPGLVACAFAQRARHVTGVDITPAMIEQARQLQKGKGLSNLTWQVGDVLPLPYGDSAFSMVITRYTFHHFVHPQAVLSEMKRVCVPSGKVVVIDASPASDKQNAYNHMEKLRDPSHVKAFTIAELLAMMDRTGLRVLKTRFYKVESELEHQLAASFPNPGDADRIRALLRADLGKDNLGVAAHARGNEIHFAFPIAIVVAQCP